MTYDNIGAVDEQIRKEIFPDELGHECTFQQFSLTLKLKLHVYLNI